MFPKINDVLYISMDTEDENEAKAIYKSRIADLDDNAMLIEVPIADGSGRLKKLYIGDELSASFTTEGGMNHYFNSYVLGYQEDAVPLVRIRKPEKGDITSVQRRGYLRVTAELELSVTTKGSPPFLTKTVDVGGGGVSFHLNTDVGQRMEEGMVASFWILIPYKNGALEHVPFEGEVVRVQKLSSSQSVAMVKFVQILDVERQKLIRFCFERQFDLRKV